MNRIDPIPHYEEKLLFHSRFGDLIFRWSRHPEVPFCFGPAFSPSAPKQGREAGRPRLGFAVGRVYLVLKFPA